MTKSLDADGEAHDTLATPAEVWDEQKGGHATAGTTGKALIDTETKVGVLHDTRIPGVVQPQTGDSFARIGAPAGASIAADIAAEKAVVDATKTKVDTLHDTRIPGVVQPQTGDSFARLGAPAGASVSADVAAAKADTAAIKAKTDNLPAAPAAQAKLDTLHDTRIPGVVQPQTGDSFARLGAPAGASVSADIATRAAPGDAMALTGAERTTLKTDLPKKEAVTAFANAALGTVETTIVEKGAVGGTDHFWLDGALVNVAALGTGTTTVKLRLYAEINGVSTLIETVDRTVTGAFNLAKSFGVPVCSRYVKVTVQRNEGSGTDGSVSASVETSKATA